MKPIIVTAGNEKFRECIEVSVVQIKKFGYTPLVWDLGNLKIGVPYAPTFPIVTRYDNSKPETSTVRVGHPHNPHKRINKCNRKALGLFKPECILHSMRTVESWSWMVWLDADAFIVKPIDEVFKGDYDIAVTIRDVLAQKRGNSFLNSGVVVVRNTKNAYRFIKQWILEQKKPVGDRYNDPRSEAAIHDQASLHEVFYSWGRPLSPKLKNKIININSVKVKCLPWKIYNRTFSSLRKWHSILDEDKSKIWHMQKAYFPSTARTKKVVLKTLRRTL